MSVYLKLPTKPQPPVAMTQSIPPTYDAPTEEDLRVLSGYDVVFLVDDVVSKTLRSTWTDVGPYFSAPFALDSPSIGQRSNEKSCVDREPVRSRRS